MTLNVNLEEVPDAILEAVMARILRNRQKMQDNQQQIQRPLLQPKPQVRNQGADNRTWKKPEPAATQTGSNLLDVLLVPDPFTVESLVLSAKAKDRRNVAVARSISLIEPPEDPAPVRQWTYVSNGGPAGAPCLEAGPQTSSVDLSDPNIEPPTLDEACRAGLLMVNQGPITSLSLDSLDLYDATQFEITKELGPVPTPTSLVAAGKVRSFTLETYLYAPTVPNTYRTTEYTTVDFVLESGLEGTFTVQIIDCVPYDGIPRCSTSTFLTLYGDDATPALQLNLSLAIRDNTTVFDYLRKASFGCSANNYEFSDGFDSVNDDPENADAPIAGWNHFAATYGGNAVSFFLNGRKLYTSDLPITPNLGSSPFLLLSCISEHEILSNTPLPIRTDNQTARYLGTQEQEASENAFNPGRIHGLRFTPRVLYSKNFTPPTSITRLA
jgi:hypothetical protein